ncbi:MAG: hypothetical protein KC486_25930 [Myxococcales bacterium]|nr:hypothetical protein [Myxococcales bacterium]MCB9596787.1 hypothetical protein [Sandaracinaceae bacterium]
MSKPIRSREGLTRCAACRAHIHAAERPSETECPFCGATLRDATPRRPVISGRGGLLAAALFAFGATACGGGEAADEDTTVEPEDTSGGDDAIDDGADDGADDGIADDGSDDGYDEDGSDGPPAVALYGVPPQ